MTLTDRLRDWWRCLWCGIIDGHNVRTEVRFKRQDVELINRLIAYDQCLLCGLAGYVAVALSDGRPWGDVTLGEYEPGMLDALAKSWPKRNVKRMPWPSGPYSIPYRQRA